MTRSEWTKKGWKDVPYEKRAARTKNALEARWGVTRPSPEAMKWAKELKVSLKTAQNMNSYTREALLSMTPRDRSMCMRIGAIKFQKNKSLQRKAVVERIDRMMELATKRRA